MKDITIKIVGRRYAEGELEDEMEFVSDAKMYERAGARYLLYDESEFSGFPGCKTSLKLTDSSIRMKRIGGEDSGFGADLVFEKGKRFTSIYETPYGSFDMEVLTTDIHTNLDDEGFGKVVLGYDVSLEGLDEGRNEIDIEIMQ